MDVPFAAGNDLVYQIDGHVREGLQVFADIAVFADQGDSDADHALVARVEDDRFPIVVIAFSRFIGQLGMDDTVRGAAGSGDRSP